MEQAQQFKIFLVDDDVFTLNLYQQHLNNLGFFDVSTFHSGTACLEELMQKPDVIFLDHNMDTLTGFDVLKKIKRFDPNVFVVMVSAQEELKIAVDALKYGAFDYIIKGDQEVEKMRQVLNRITQVLELLKKEKPSFWKKILSYI
ncbi:response regulator [Rapidithrix thailandica]|uniref:Response regulator n=1 Tax=Rapidithrix thailandica TaxID=413964 RepID=A0AAW9RYF9_9BACT